MSPHFSEVKTGRNIGCDHIRDDDRAKWMHARAAEHAKITGKEVQEIEDKQGSPCSKFPNKYPTK